MYKLQTFWSINRYQIRPFMIALVILVLVASVGGTIIWLLPRFSNNTVRNISNDGNGAHEVTNVTSVSPLIFGSNLQLATMSNQVLDSASTRSLLQNIHIRTIRIPLSSNLSDTKLRSAVQTVQQIGATPIVILRGITDTHALDDDIHAIGIINALFGQQTVYYEYDNEVDALGITVQQYVDSWNAVIPHLKQIAPHGQFVGPVNSQYNSQYLTTFLQNARPMPDAVSWHEYTCDRSWSNDICISNIADWTTHFKQARQIMRTAVHMELPIMITEWNYAANARSNDDKSNNSAFMITWTTQAFQALAANHILASMQYASTDSATPLIGRNERLTAQGLVFQHEYEQLIPKGKMPKPKATTQSTSTATSTSTASQPGGSTVTTVPSSTPTEQPVSTVTSQPIPMPTPTKQPVPVPTPTKQPAPTPQPHKPLHYINTYCTSDDVGASVSGQWSTSSSGGYGGAASHGSCNGSFLWTLTASTTNHTATYFEYLPGGYNWNCTIFVYIPTNHAGAPHATYWIHSQSQYLANITVNQEANSAWYRLQSQPFQFTTSPASSSNYISAQLRNNDSATGWDLAIDAIKFDCSGS